MKNYITRTLAAIAIPAAITFSGCASINGIAKDVKDLSGFVADSTQKYVDARDEGELTRAEKMRRTQIDKAAALINARYSSNNAQAYEAHK